MSIDIQFLDRDTDQQRIYKLRMLVEEVSRLSRQRSSTTSSANAADAEYILAGSNAALPAGRVLVANSGVGLALTPGLATLSLSSVPLSSMAPITSGVLLGRYTPGAGEPQTIGIGTGLELTTSGVLQAAAVGEGYSAVLGHAGI